MRDENGFKCHTQSESHVRQMLLIGEDPRKHIQDFSNQFQRDFLQLLRTSHGEKKVHINHFYQEYIANKEHVHMNATRWPSLTEFAKYLGREGICRVEETEKGLHVSWIDNSPEALRRQDAIRKKERQDKGDEEREQRLIREQVARAQADAEATRRQEESDAERVLERDEGEKVKLSFTAKQKEPKSIPEASPAAEDTQTAVEEPAVEEHSADEPPVSDAGRAFSGAKTSMKMGVSKPKNIFAAAAKKNALSGQKGTGTKEQPKKPMSEAERIMKEEIERKRVSGSIGLGSAAFKRQKIS